MSESLVKKVNIVHFQAVTAFWTATFRGPGAPAVDNGHGHQPGGQAPATCPCWRSRGRCPARRGNRPAGGEGRDTGRQAAPLAGPQGLDDGPSRSVTSECVWLSGRLYMLRVVGFQGLSFSMLVDVMHGHMTCLPTTGDAETGC